MPGRKFSSGEYRFGFNGKEKNSEIAEGNYDFGARIYDGRIGRWWSVDPLSGSLLYISPYNSFSNNPIINVDPDGKADIYFNGNWIGTDGVDDNLIAVVRDKSIVNAIKRQTKGGLYYPTINLPNGDQNNQFKVLDKDIMTEAVSTTKRAMTTMSVDDTEYSAVMSQNDEGKFETTFTGSNLETIIAADGTERARGGRLPDGDISLHSHPIGYVTMPDGRLQYHRADQPSPDDNAGNGDIGVFTRFDLNIIVGSVGEPRRDYETGLYKERPVGIIVYGSNSVEKTRFNYEEAGRMVKNDDKVNNKAKANFEKKRAANEKKQAANK